MRCTPTIAAWSLETNPRIKAIWECFLDYELGHLNLVSELFKKYERRDPAEILPETLPDPIAFESQREFVRKILNQEVDLRAQGPDYVHKDDEGIESQDYRNQLNSEGSPSEEVGRDYQWYPGTELARKSA